MEEFEDQWLRMEDPLPFAYDGPESYHNARFDTYHDVTLHVPINDGSGADDTTHVERSETAIDDVSETFEFFDLQSATLDLGHPRSLEEHVSRDSASVTLYSAGGQHATPNVAKSPDNGESVTVTQPFLHYSFDEDMANTNPEPYPAATSTPNFSNGDAGESSKHGKRPFQGTSIAGILFEPMIPTNPVKKRKKLTPEQLEGSRKVRAHGACLRCYVQKLKCSEGRPCKTCQILFEKAMNTKALQWTVCVSSSLLDLNIFALGVSVFEDGESHPSGRGINKKLSTTTILSMYNVLFENGIVDTFISIDDLYTRILQHSYGHRASEVHPFILEDPNPLYLLVKLNVLLLGSPVIGIELIGCVRYLQKLRAVCAIVAFECLERVLDRTTLAKSSQVRQSALVVQAALLLEQVVDMSGDLPAAAISCAKGTTYEEMRRHLIQFLSYYLQKLVPCSRGAFSNYMQKFENQGHLGEDFWSILSQLVPSIPLLKPPILRRYAEMSWNDCEGESGEALYEYYTAHFSISCKYWLGKSNVGP